MDKDEDIYLCKPSLASSKRRLESSQGDQNIRESSESPNFAHDVLGESGTRVLLTLLLILIVSSFLTIPWIPSSMGIILDNYPLGLLQTLPPAVWVTSLAYNIIGLLIVLKGKMSSFNQRYLLFITSLMVVLKVATPGLIVKMPYGPDAFWHYSFSNSIIQNGHVMPGYSYWSWPGVFIFTSILKIVANLDPYIIFYFVPTLWSILIILYVYLIARRWLGQPIALLSAFVLANLTTPLGEAMYLSPHGMAMLLAMMIIYFKANAIFRDERRLRYAAMGLIVLGALTITHLIVSVGLGMFFAGMFTVERSWPLLSKRVNQIKISKHITLLAFLVLPFIMVTSGYIFIVPLLAFLSGVYLSTTPFGMLPRHVSKRANSFLRPFIVFAFGLLFLFGEVNLIKLLISFMLGFWISKAGHAISAAHEFELLRRTERRSQTLPLVTLIFISMIAWWWFTAPDVFVDLATVTRSFLTQYQMIVFHPLGNLPPNLMQKFELSSLWYDTLRFMIIMMIILGVYLAWKRSKGATTRFISLVGGVFAMWGAMRIIPGYGTRLDPMFILLGVVAMSAVLVTNNKMGHRRFSLLTLICIFSLMSFSFLGAYDPHIQSYLMTKEDESAGIFISDKTPLPKSQLIFIGDSRIYALARYRSPELGEYQYSFEFQDALRLEKKGLGYGVFHADYILLSNIAKYKWIFEGIDLHLSKDRIDKLKTEPHYLRIYHNGYNEIYIKS